MNRREFNVFLGSTWATLAVSTSNLVHATTLANLGAADATKGLKTALEKSVIAAVKSLGVSDGFLGNDKVRIPLPGYLEDAAGLMRKFGIGSQIDELVTAMNRGAEAAVPGAKRLLLKAVREMSVSDAKDILSQGDTSVTQFFSNKTRPALGVEFLPVVTKATQKFGLAQKYNQVAGKAADFGLLKKDDANVEGYVTGKTLDGLFFMIAEEEKKIRQNPLAYGSTILTKVFGNLK